MQIRLYATEDRKELSDTGSDKWPAAFSKVGNPDMSHAAGCGTCENCAHATCALQYLKDLECPFSLKPSAAPSNEVMDWLLHYAVDLAYTDSGKNCQKAFLAHLMCLCCSTESL